MTEIPLSNESTYIDGPNEAVAVYCIVIFIASIKSLLKVLTVVVYWMVSYIDSIEVWKGSTTLPKKNSVPFCRSVDPNNPLANSAINKHTEPYCQWEG